MLIQLILFTLIGIFLGTLTGLTPGIHINLISIFLISTYSIININTTHLLTLITSMSITHTFVDFIPSIFLGCPDTDTELSILPGHKLLKKSHGYQAVHLTCYGSLFAIFLLILIAIPSITLIPKIQSLTQNFIPFILIIVLTILTLTETYKLKSLLVLTLTGILGLCILNLELNEPLLPLLTGLFGTSSLIISIKNQTLIPKQKIIKPKITSIKPVFSAALTAPLCSFLPSLGSGQAAIIANTIIKNNQKDFLILIGAINTLVMGFSFLSLYTISKTRTGTTLAISQITTLNPNLLLLILIITLISGIISFYLTLFLAKTFSQNIHKINYTKTSTITIAIITIITLLICGPLGILTLIISTLTGIYSIKTKAKRTNMMGCLIIPTIINYLF
ncbi:MAG: tripartite tricarboxylate transporter permease [Candidatus Pacearchaeota archaeon]|nr:tripartite tricarboxylate transporter permease [Candidatus Pacearchaeota archaeon]